MSSRGPWARAGRAPLRQSWRSFGLATGSYTGWSCRNLGARRSALPAHNPLPVPCLTRVVVKKVAAPQGGASDDEGHARKLRCLSVLFFSPSPLLSPFLNCIFATYRHREGPLLLTFPALCQIIRGGGCVLQRLRPAHPRKQPSRRPSSPPPRRWTGVPQTFSSFSSERPYMAAELPKTNVIYPVIDA
eukprot:178900-Rhodomonas_salina.2